MSVPLLPVGDVGVVYESTVTVADAPNSGLVPGGRFFRGSREKSMEVEPVVMGDGVSGESREARQVVDGVS